MVVLSHFKKPWNNHQYNEQTGGTGIGHSAWNLFTEPIQEAARKQSSEGYETETGVDIAI